MNAKKLLVPLLVLVVLVSGATDCAAATIAAAKTTKAAAEVTKAAAVQAITPPTSVDQTPPPATPTAVTAQVPIRTATATPTQVPTPVTEKIEPQGQRFYLHADGVLAMAPPPSNARSDTACLSECTQTWAITLTHPLQGNAYGYHLVGIDGSYNVRLLHTRGDHQMMLTEWLGRRGQQSGWQRGPQLDAVPGDVLTPEITLPASGSIQLDDYGRNSYVTVGTATMALSMESISPASGWELSTVEDGKGPLGIYTSLALDMDDHPHISYYDQTKEYLMYAHWDGASWDIQVVDSEVGAVGVGGWTYKARTTIAVSSDGYPRIAYYSAPPKPVFRTLKTE